MIPIIPYRSECNPAAGESIKVLRVAVLENPLLTLAVALVVTLEKA